MSSEKHTGHTSRYILAAVLLAATWLISGLGTSAQAAPLQSRSASHNGLIVRILPHATVNACGTLTAFTAASAAATGTITIGGQTFVIAQNTVLSGMMATVGTDLCLTGQTNTQGQITGGNIGADVGTSLTICGTVTSFLAATATTAGSITIGSQTLDILPGASLTGSAFAVGSNICLQATLNGAGQVQSGTVSLNAAATIHVCGTVSAYVAATASAPGSITINNQTFVITTGTTLSGVAVVNGSPFCLDATTNTAGQITGGTISADSTTNISVCGTVTAYTPASTSTAGSITIGGTVYVLVAGSVLTGPTVTVGNAFCLNATTNGSGQITGGTVTVTAPTNVNVCGIVSAYTPATVSTAGSITIAGTTIIIAPGTTLTGAAIVPGNPFCLYVTTNTSGQITGGTVTVNAATTITICGLVTAFTNATTTTAGSITIAGQTFTIAPGTTLAGATVTVGGTFGITVSVNAPSTIVSGTVTAGCSTTGTSTPTGTLTATVTSTATSTATTVPTATATTAAATATSTTVPATATSTTAAATATSTTAAATATATTPPTATPAPTALGALPQLVARSSLHHHGKTAVVQWRMAFQFGMKGFRIYANSRNLTSRMIAPHHNRNYSARVAWVAHARYSLRLFFKNGHARKVAIH